MPKRIIKMKDYFDTWSLIVIIFTFILFVIALFVKGITKDLLMEMAVLLVSIKLIMGSYKTSVNTRKLNKDLEEIKRMIREGK